MSYGRECRSLARLERATYRFVACTGDEADHHQDDPSTTKDRGTGQKDREE
jgi:hypothetical protein